MKGNSNLPHCHRQILSINGGCERGVRLLQEIAALIANLDKCKLGVVGGWMRRGATYVARNARHDQIRFLKISRKNDAQSAEILLYGNPCAYVDPTLAPNTKRSHPTL